jgi:hypothetical protein
MSPVIGTRAGASARGYGGLGSLLTDIKFGFVLGGQDNSGTSLNSVLKFGFTTETQSILNDTLTQAAYGSSAGVSYENNQAYKIGGNGTLDAQRYISKWAYSTGTKTNLSTTATARGYAAGISNPTTAGYAWGGEGGSPLVYYTTAQKVSYSNDSLTTLSPGGASNTNQPASANNGSTAGYRIGGDTGNLGKITFSNETFSITGAFTSINLEYTSASIYGTNSAYTMGGQFRDTGVLTNRVQKFTFSGESFSNVSSATLSTSRSLSAALSNRASHGYALGGSGGSTTIQKLSFVTESISTLGSTLATPRANGANADNY